MVSKGLNKHDFYHKKINHAFLPKQNFEGYRDNAKKDYAENQNFFVEGAHPEPDHANFFI